MKVKSKLYFNYKFLMKSLMRKKLIKFYLFIENRCIIDILFAENNTGKYVEYFKPTRSLNLLAHISVYEKQIILIFSSHYNKYVICMFSIIILFIKAKYEYVIIRSDVEMNRFFFFLFFSNIH